MTTPINPTEALQERLSRIHSNLRAGDPDVLATNEQIQARAEQANLRTYALARVRAQQRQAVTPQWAAALVKRHTHAAGS